MSNLTVIAQNILQPVQPQSASASASSPSPNPAPASRLATGIRHAEVRQDPQSALAAQAASEFCQRFVLSHMPLYQRMAELVELACYAIVEYGPKMLQMLSEVPETAASIGPVLKRYFGDGSAAAVVAGAIAFILVREVLNVLSSRSDNPILHEINRSVNRMSPARQRAADAGSAAHVASLNHPAARFDARGVPLSREDAAIYEAAAAMA